MAFTHVCAQMHAHRCMWGLSLFTLELLAALIATLWLSNAANTFSGRFRFGREGDTHCALE